MPKPHQTSKDKRIAIQERAAKRSARRPHLVPADQPQVHNGRPVLEGNNTRRGIS